MGKAKDEILGSMGPLEKLAAWKLAGWVKREGKSVLKNILGEKATSVIAVGGVMLAAWVGAEQLGQVDVLTAAQEVALLGFIAFMQSCGLFVARDPRPAPVKR